MTTDAMNTALRGRVGVWLRRGTADAGLARHLEDLGYSSVWIGGSPAADLAVAEELLDATASIRIATGVVNIWRSDGWKVAESYVRVAERYGDRFLLGIGAGHPEVAGPAAERPYEAVSRYLDVLDQAGVPADHRVLAALGPRMLRLAAERSRGAHPFLVPPSHTRDARALLGTGPLLVPEQRVVLESDRDTARALARASLERYLQLTNYRTSLLRQGFREADLDHGGSDWLVDELVPFGTPEEVAGRLADHLGAGADEVAVQLIPRPGERDADGFARLAVALQIGAAE
ncbi:TIGR03620 family F420-dependent LLM class oxidoreductase [Lysobacter korlensis]|uniref:TIGR03620 family F420-dependent LLM class oxidoreductase n=1 Tax=Lysobacter korlensis TaxID=553636 RepID=A0ABV6RVM8_9GAMM